jgi:hypothetical protein
VRCWTTRDLLDARAAAIVIDGARSALQASWDGPDAVARAGAATLARLAVLRSSVAPVSYVPPADAASVCVIPRGET